MVDEVAVLEPLEVGGRLLARLDLLVVQAAEVVADLVAGHDELAALGDPAEGLHVRPVRPDGRDPARPAVRLGQHQQGRVGRVPVGGGNSMELVQF